MVHVAHTALVFSSMRVYAMSNRSVVLAALVGILSMVPIVGNAVCLIVNGLIQKMADRFAVSGIFPESRRCSWLLSFEAAG